MQPHTPFRRYIAALTVGGFITALLLFALPTYAAAHSGQANPTPTPTLTIPTPTPTPVPPTPVAITPTPTVQQPTSISDCPGAIPNATTPSIEFCSPRFKGNEEGPYGTHITLLGRNIPGSLTGLYLLQVAKGKSPPPSVHINNNNCTPSAQCFPVDNVQPPLSQIQKTQLFPLSFNWTIQGAAPNKDYYAVLTYLPQNHAGKTSDVPPAISPIGFTLLSSNAPCITISLDQNAKESCTISQNTQQVTVGSTMYIHGENWNSGGVSQTINVELNTCQQPPCPRGSQVLLTQSIPFNSDGTFTSSSVPLKRDLVGDYWITAQMKHSRSVIKNWAMLVLCT